MTSIELLNEMLSTAKPLERERVFRVTALLTDPFMAHWTDMHWSACPDTESCEQKDLVMRIIEGRYTDTDSYERIRAPRTLTDIAYPGRFVQRVGERLDTQYLMVEG